jgi:hypothetical protein
MLKTISGATGTPAFARARRAGAISAPEPRYPMSDHPMRGFARAFCDALSGSEPERLAPLIHDDIDWTVFGPVDLFPFFGHRQGKTAVLAMLKRIVERMQLRDCDSECALTDGDRAASMMRVTLRDLRSDRTLSLRLALFARFSGRKLTALRAVFDSFDAVEQALGRHIDLSVA